MAHTHGCCLPTLLRGPGSPFSPWSVEVAAGTKTREGSLVPYRVSRVTSSDQDWQSAPRRTELPPPALGVPLTITVVAISVGPTRAPVVPATLTPAARTKMGMEGTSGVSTSPHPLQDRCPTCYSSLWSFHSPHSWTRTCSPHSRGPHLLQRAQKEKCQLLQQCPPPHPHRWHLPLEKPRPRPRPPRKKPRPPAEPPRYPRDRLSDDLPAWSTRICRPSTDWRPRVNTVTASAPPALGLQPRPSGPQSGHPSPSHS